MATAQQEFAEAKPHIEAGDAYYDLIALDAVRKYIPSINYGSLQVDSKGKVTWNR